LAEGFDQARPGALPRGWETGATGTAVLWGVTTNEPPNLATGEAEDRPLPEDADTHFSVSTILAPGVGESFLTTAPFTLATDRAELYFRQAFQVASTNDGANLEISIAGQPFRDLVQAGGSIVQSTYNGVVVSRDPAVLRSGWTGNSGGWLPTLAKLPPDLRGQTVQLRWHLTSGFSATNGAWFIDSVVVTEPLCVPPGPFISASRTSQGLALSFNTTTNRNHTVEYKTNLTEAVWHTLQSLTGSGHQETVVSPIGQDRFRFFRLKVDQ